MKIQIKLILGFIIIALLICVSSWISINMAQKALQESIGKNSVFLAQETLDKIDRDIYNRIERWQSYISTNLRLVETLAESNQEFENIGNVQNYINLKDQEWTSMPKETITPFMQEIINNELSKRLEKRIKFYEEQENYRVFGEVFVTNKYGANVAQSGKTSDYYQADEEWWQNAKKDGLYVADVEYDKSAGIYSTDICIKIEDENGNFLGVMKIVLNIEEVYRILDNLQDESESNIHTELVDKNGLLLYHDKIRMKDFGEDISQENAVAEVIAGNNGFMIRQLMHHEHSEEKFLRAYAHSKGYQEYRGLDWSLILNFETEEIFQPITKLRNILLIVLIGMVLLAILIGLFSSKSITKPIKELEKCARKIRKGNLNIKCDIKSNDEIQEFAETFNEMRLGLKDRNELLNSLLKTFKGKFGKLATILVRKNVQELVEKNPRILKIVPKTLRKTIRKPKQKRKR